MDTRDKKSCTYLMSCARSPSDMSPKFPSDSQILMSRFVLKNPLPSPALSAMPTSSKPLAFSRAFGFGLRSFLNEGKIRVGIAPLEEA
jgi:hypothetical protein